MSHRSVQQENDHDDEEETDRKKGKENSHK